MNAHPRVLIDEGLRLDDDTARRFAEAMLRDMTPMFDKVAVTMNRQRHERSSLANPIGQQRVFKRLCNSGPMNLDAYLVTGKRGYFQMRFVTFCVYGPRLGVDLITLRGEGLKKELAYDCKPIITFSLHALQRLIQRAGVRRAEDFYPMLKAVCRRSLIVGAGMNMVGRACEGEVWPLPVSVAGTPLILLTKQTDDGALVSTVYPGEWRELPEFDGLPPPEAGWTDSFDLGAWVAAFRKAAPRFRSAA